MSAEESVRMAIILERIEKRMDRVESDLYSTDSRSPGVAMRLDRIEGHLKRAFGIVSWIGGGGLLGLAATGVLLYKILQVLPGGGS